MKSSTRSDSQILDAAERKRLAVGGGAVRFCRPAKRPYLSHCRFDAYRLPDPINTQSAVGRPTLYIWRGSRKVGLPFALSSTQPRRLIVHFKTDTIILKYCSFPNLESLDVGSSVSRFAHRPALAAQNERLFLFFFFFPPTTITAIILKHLLISKPMRQFTVKSRLCQRNHA